MTRVARELDPPILDWVVRSALPGRRVVHAETLTGGHVNDNVLIVSDTDDRYVLRRYPRRDTCAIEAALAVRLAGVVPVPEVVAADPDGTAAGQPLLLSRFVTGTPLGSVLSAAGAGAGAGDLGRAVGGTLAAIGSVGFPSPGFFADATLRPVAFEPTRHVATFVGDRLTTAALSDDEKESLVELARGYEPVLETVAGARQLVHADFNPKNILVCGTAVVAVLDWEFAFSSTPLFDLANMLRFESRYPGGYIDGFVAGYVAGAGELPPDWRRICAGLDLFALADFLTRPPEHPYFRKALALVRARIGAGAA